MLLVVLGLVLGIVPALLEPLLQSYAQTAGPDPRGRDGALARLVDCRSRCRRPAGLVGAGDLRRATGQGTPAARSPGPAANPERSTGRPPGVSTSIADGVTAATQRGSLPVSLGAILLVLVAFPGTMLIQGEHRARRTSSVLGEPAAAGAVAGDPRASRSATVRVTRGLTAVMLVGGVGYAVAVLFILRGAPDLALTQILVETVTLIAALLVLTRLPDTRAVRLAQGQRLPRRRSRWPPAR